MKIIFSRPASNKHFAAISQRNKRLTIHGEAPKLVNAAFIFLLRDVWASPPVVDEPRRIAGFDDKR